MVPPQRPTHTLLTLNTGLSYNTMHYPQQQVDQYGDQRTHDHWHCHPPTSITVLTDTEYLHHSGFAAPEARGSGSSDTFSAPRKHSLFSTRYDAPYTEPIASSAPLGYLDASSDVDYPHYQAEEQMGLSYTPAAFDNKGYYVDTPQSDNTNYFESPQPSPNPDVPFSVATYNHRARSQSCHADYTSDARTAGPIRQHRYGRGLALRTTPEMRHQHRASTVSPQMEHPPDGPNTYFNTFPIYEQNQGVEESHPSPFPHYHSTPAPAFQHQPSLFEDGQHQPVPPSRQSSYSELSANVAYLTQRVSSSSSEPYSNSSYDNHFAFRPSQSPTEAVADGARYSPKHEPTKKPGEAKKQTLACLFCRERKIACGRPSEDNPDQTCNQCLRRAFKCEYPTESRRGQHKRARRKTHDVNTAA